MKFNFYNYNKIINFVMYIYFVIFIYMLSLDLYFNGITWTLILDFLPFIIYFLYEKFEKTRSNIFLFIIKLFIILIIPFYYLTALSGLLLFNEIPFEPSKLTYPVAIKQLQNMYNVNLSYFPQHIPFKAYDYNCLFRTAFQNSNFSYIVSFKTTKNYIENVIKDNKNKIVNVIPNKREKYINLESSYHHSIGTAIPSSHDVYLLSKQGYSDIEMGFAIDEKSNSIYFFFTNKGRVYDVEA